MIPSIIGGQRIPSGEDPPVLETEAGDALVTEDGKQILEE